MYRAAVNTRPVYGELGGRIKVVLVQSSEIIRVGVLFVLG